MVYYEGNEDTNSNAPVYSFTVSRCTFLNNSAIDGDVGEIYT